EGVGIFHQKRFTGEEIMHPHAAIEISVCRLLGGQLNRASDRSAAGLFGAAFCRFHDPGATASYDSETKPCNGCAHFSRQLVMRIARLDPGRAEDRYARTEEGQSGKGAQENE